MEKIHCKLISLIFIFVSSTMEFNPFGRQCSENGPRESSNILENCSIMFVVLASMACFYFCKKCGENRLFLIRRQNHDRSNHEQQKEAESCTRTFKHLPDWLKDHQEMLFAREHIIRNVELGRGKYGVVYKGSISQGKAW